MNAFRICCSVLLLASTVAATGCATHTQRGDAPWDPKPQSGHRLHDVLPNWDHGPGQRCQPYRTPGGQLAYRC
jgi:hypothetical protein